LGCVFSLAGVQQKIAVCGEWRVIGELLGVTVNSGPLVRSANYLWPSDSEEGQSARGERRGGPKGGGMKLCRSTEGFDDNTINPDSNQ